MKKLEIRDDKTGELFSLDVGENRAVVRTTDGERIRVHPAVVVTMVRVGQKFDGITLKGHRRMERLR